MTQIMQIMILRNIYDNLMVELKIELKLIFNTSCNIVTKITVVFVLFSML